MSQSPSRIYGVDINEDLDPALLRRDIRPFRLKAQDFFATKGPWVVFAFGIFIVANAVFPLEMVPKLFEISFLMGGSSALYTRKMVKDYMSYPWVEPISPGDDREAREDKGLYLLGNEKNQYRNLWLTSSQAKTHVLCFGTTGSGKSRFLLGILYQAMLSGSGAMYVDGKGDNTIWWLVFSFARRADRVDDLLLINYLTGGNNYSIAEKRYRRSDGTIDQMRKADGSPIDKRITNTTNPLAQGTAEQLRSLLVGLMRESGGEGEMWKGRSSSMLKALLETLTILRDDGEINLDVDTVRHYMVLDRIVELTKRSDLPEMSILSIKKYLLELPGFSEEDAEMGVLGGECYKQHNFLTMQLTEVMSDLSGTYGHIFRAELGEVDFKDLVFNSRILFVMLPALEKDPDALAGLGKMIVAGVRSALAPALGEDVEGSKSSVTDVKPTNALEAFVLILDEYGYYAVKGFSVAAAQARSLGVSIYFAGQDYPSFTKASKEEAEAIVANTTTTICMALEDSGETAEKIIARGAETEAQKSAGHKKKDNGSGYKDEGGVRSEKQKVIDLRDLVNQGKGAAHVIRGSEVHRSQLYFADPTEVDEVELNKFLMVNRPNKESVESLRQTYDQIDKLISGDHVREDKVSFDETILNLFNDFSMAGSRQLDAKTASCHSVGASLVRLDLDDEIERRSQNQSLSESESQSSDPVTEPPKEVDKTNSSAIEQNPDEQKSVSSSDDWFPDRVSNRVIKESSNRDEVLDAVTDEIKQESVSGEAKRASDEFVGLLAETITRVSERDRQGEPLSGQEKESFNPIRQLEEGGSSDPMYEFDVISEKTKSYPSGEVPHKPDLEEIMSSLNSVRLEIQDRSKNSD